MGIWHKRCKDVLANAAAYKAIGDTQIYLDETDPDLPWGRVTKVEAGGGVRLSGPTGVYLIAEVDGLTLKWSVDFEERSANGSSVHQFDRPRLRELMRKLPPKAKKQFADFLQDEVAPAVEKLTGEWRGYLNRQLDSEDCLRGLIADARAV